jgi:hypothetical protein
MERGAEGGGERNTTSVGERKAQKSRMSSRCEVTGPLLFVERRTRMRGAKAEAQQQLSPRDWGKEKNTAMNANTNFEKYKQETKIVPALVGEVGVVWLTLQ